MNHALVFNLEERNHMRNLGAYRIAHWLRQQDWDIEVIDYALLWTYEELVELAKTRITKSTKFIGFSFQFGVWNFTMDRFALWLNNFYPDIKLISGSSILPPIDTPVDYHIWGFGEYALDNLFKYLFSNGTKPKMKKYGSMYVIDASQYPAYPLNDYSVSYEDRDFLQPWEFLCIETGRGCIFKCSFCNFSILGVKTDHSTSEESFERQMKENYSRWGIKNYTIAEETFNDRPDKIRKLAKVVNRLDFTPWFSAFVRFDLLVSRPDDKKLLEDMNVLGQYYGIESFNHKTAKAFRKGMDPDRIKEKLVEVKDYYSKTGLYRGTISLILGGPHETKESMYNSLKWCEDNWAGQALVSFPLGIPLGKNRRPSEFTDNYEKFGYKKIKISELRKRYPKDKEIFKNGLSRNKKPGDNSLVWENENTDIVECYKIYKDFQRSKMENFKPTGFGIGRFTGKESTIEDKLKIWAHEEGKWIDQEFQWYSEYINKKLNWIK